ncbi:hypothetical protein BASA50_011155 [Batrachochytrium salamandrivorans]|uniref:Rhodanese domain-containing protein n=1 Tax=Batrachochytrium salamandrivorans TaxID=1357716 RepID=A0ABQ8EWF8_9FUNG|nr:hypothetical protein BASA62_004530 [Batrachochytrium salamandrivorans]KAH6582602.1 hypothetical protein BASA60_001847 [Batrachochytrium salamandrivorans]KAH6587764.1 hypothetical protein BASA50_011155 [Batrachochytrium salamandrivorans]KAH6589051.1 hypothetical protein BASA61_005755 [Batrachochytrium salamandrivorans]KAH9252355.1 hypothetical protein BASA81_009726 [Batrachochytrium salamandrivorans]
MFKSSLTAARCSSLLTASAMRMPLLPRAAAFSVTPTTCGRFADHVSAVRPNIKEMTVAELNKRLSLDPIHGPPSSLHILDIRETYEWNEEHIPFAIYTGRGNLERDIEGVAPDVYEDVILYCAGGVRSVLAADALQKMGYRNVYSLTGGIAAWKKAKLPIIQSPSTYSEKAHYG